MKAKIIASMKTELMMTDLIYRREQWPSMVRWYVPHSDDGVNLNMVLAPTKKAAELEKIYRESKV